MVKPAEPSRLSMSITVGRYKESIDHLNAELHAKHQERLPALDEISRIESQYELLIAEQEAIRSNDIVGLTTWKQIQDLISQHKMSLTNRHEKLAKITSDLNEVRRALEKTIIAHGDLKKRLDDMSAVVLCFTRTS